MPERHVFRGWTIPVLDKGFVRLIDFMGSDESICEAARISYRAPSKGEEQDRKLIEYLWKNKHTSPFEMVKMKFNIRMPLFVMRQYVRHRMQNLNEVSARYTELPNEFYIPKHWRKQDTKNKQGSVEDTSTSFPILDEDGRYIGTATECLIKHCDDSYLLYTRMLKAGIAREMARMVLPLNIYTEIYACWDIKNLLHFITLRSDVHAQDEIRQFSNAIGEMVEKLYPWTWKAYKKYQFQVTTIE
jgi:thymidylate synthase (FAD)